MLYMINKSPLMFGNLASVLRIAPAGEPIADCEPAPAPRSPARSNPLAHSASPAASNASSSQSLAESHS